LRPERTDKALSGIPITAGDEAIVGIGACAAPGGETHDVSIPLFEHELRANAFSRLLAKAKPVPALFGSCCGRMPASPRSWPRSGERAFRATAFSQWRPRRGEADDARPFGGLVKTSLMDQDVFERIPNRNSDAPALPNAGICGVKSSGFCCDCDGQEDGQRKK
jgi:hypothetical protein